MTLSGLAIGSATIEPEFNPQVTTYTGTFPADATSLTVSASKASEEATWGKSHEYSYWADVRRIKSDGTFDLLALPKPLPNSEPTSLEASVSLAADVVQCEIKIKVSLNGTVVEYKITMTREEE